MQTRRVFTALVASGQEEASQASGAPLSGTRAPAPAKWAAQRWPSRVIPSNDFCRKLYVTLQSRERAHGRSFLSGRLCRGSSSVSRPIEGVATSIAAFVGATKSGPTDAPVAVRSFADFTAQFGGLSDPHPLSYAVQHYFANGGREALIARVAPAGT